ncbi:MAG: VPLPA-CTERM sorting domain-containing protein, partial [Alphaproteobacteria bacterium]
IEIVMDATALEIASWQFVDPGATLPLPALSTVSARPAGGAPSAAVPLPATLPLLVGALGGLALTARRRRAA